MNFDPTARGDLPSASGIPAAALCPGKQAAERGLPEETSEHAEAGTRIHAALAAIATGQQSPDLVAAMDALDEAEADTTQRCWKQTEELAERFDCTWPALAIEKRLWLMRGSEPVMSGQSDLVLSARAGTTLLIVDDKTGRVPVPRAAINRQLLALAVLGSREWPGKDIIVAIVQPWCGAPTVGEFKKEDMPAAFGSLIKILRDANQPDAPRIPGLSQCAYCRAKGTARCPESSSLVPALAEVKVPDARKDEIVDAAWLSRMLDSAALAEKVITAIRSKAKRELEAGRPVPGWTLKEGRRIRTITDAAKAFDRMADHLSALEFAGLCTVSISKLEAAFVKAADEKFDTTAKDAKAQLPGLLGDALEIKVSNPSLEREQPPKS